MIAGGLGATVMRNRLASVILVGLTGYGCGVIFAVHGAPDLALTQFLVETLTLVVFVLVLRKLPAEVDDQGSAGSRGPRAALAVAVGATVSVLGAFAVNARSAAPVSLQFPEAAYELGDQQNIVNVILVDIAPGPRTRRNLRTPRRRDRRGQPGVPQPPVRRQRSAGVRRPRIVVGHERRGGDDVAARRRSDRSAASFVDSEVTTRLIFPTIMVPAMIYFFFSDFVPPAAVSPVV